ncbi:MAG: YhfC family intramembrane metalloprotease [Ruminococcus sp.]|nr:YhfC family intramembrane metalloprotease [Ruminococcus sp.]
MFGSENLTAMGICGAVCTLFPFAALIAYKRKNRDIPVSAFFIGAGTFILFALVLEQLLHTVMLPIVQVSTPMYVVYGAFAAGFFEESGRLAAYRLLMKNTDDPRSAVMYGLGHGGCEAAAAVGLTMIAYLITAVTVNRTGAENVIALYSGGSEETAALLGAQLEALSEITLVTAFTSIFERLIAVTFHTAASVIMFRAAKEKISLYPLCILLHALADAPAAMYQRGVLPIAAVYPVFCAVTGITVYLAVRSCRIMKAPPEK